MKGRARSRDSTSLDGKEKVRRPPHLSLTQFRETLRRSTQFIGSDPSILITINGVDVNILSGQFALEHTIYFPLNLHDCVDRT